MEQVRDLNMDADDMLVVLSALSSVSKRMKEVAQTHKPLFSGEHFLTGKEVCERLYISPRTLQDYRDRRIIPYRLQTIIKSSNLHLDERVAGEEDIYANEQLKGYAPLYPLPVIIAMSFHLDSTEAYLFRKYVCQRLQKVASVITPIFLLGGTDN